MEEKIEERINLGPILIGPILIGPFLRLCHSQDPTKMLTHWVELWSHLSNFHFSCTKVCMRARGKITLRAFKMRVNKCAFIKLTQHFASENCASLKPSMIITTYFIYNCIFIIMIISENISKKY